MDTPAVLALEPWYAGSHRSVADSIDRHSSGQWNWITRPGGGARWCLRQSALSFAEEVGELVQSGGRWDAVFVSSLCSLADFRACVDPRIGRLPHLLYMHENQAAYPTSEHVDDQAKDRDAHLAFTNLSSIEAADRVLFNSEHNRGSFIAAMNRILDRSPWNVGTGWIDRLQEKSCVVWPPVPEDAWESLALHNPEPSGYADRTADGRRVVRVAWPHRWEHDKGCEELRSLIKACRDDPERQFRWSILGRRFGRVPEAMRAIEADHSDVIDHFGGPDDRGDYLRILSSCDWVTSTARHEFFGIAVVEAIACGCLPWLPDRLSYPELVPGGLAGIDPWTTGLDRSQALDALRDHLRHARAGVAVEELDRSIRQMITDDPG